MKIEDGTIHFKSRSDLWEKEKSGIKSNTVRIISDEECNRYRDEDGKPLPFTSIQITNEENGYYFVREITDITKMDFGCDCRIFIFSWG